MASKHFDKELKLKIHEEQVNVQNVNDSLKKTETFGQKVADAIAKFDGNWPFILFFLAFLWILLNTVSIFFT